MCRLSFTFLMIWKATICAFAQSCCCDIEGTDCDKNSYFFISYRGCSYEKYVGQIEYSLEERGKLYWSYIKSCNHGITNDRATSCVPVTDVNEIRRIKEKLRPIIEQSEGIIVFHSADYCKSEICRWEWQQFNEKYSVIEISYTDFLEKKKLKRNRTYFVYNKN